MQHRIRIIKFCSADGKTIFEMRAENFKALMDLLDQTNQYYD